MWVILLACVTAVFASAQTAQDAAIARQRESIERQRSSLDAQGGAAARQIASAARQPKPPPWTPPPPAAAVADCSALTDSHLNQLIEKASKNNVLTPDLLRAVIRRESSFQPCAVSRSGAMGLMQLMPGTAFDLGVEDPFDAEQNIEAGSRFLRSLLDRYSGNLSLALSAYNAGPARIDAIQAVPPIKETQDYVKEILNRLRPPAPALDSQ